MPENETFAERLKRLRKAAGLTQEELAGKINVHSVTVSKWETGEQLPKTLIIKRLSTALHISEDELLNGEPEATWVLTVQISHEEEEFIDLKTLKNRPLSTIITKSNSAFLELGGSYELV